SRSGSASRTSTVEIAAPRNEARSLARRTLTRRFGYPRRSWNRRGCWAAVVVLPGVAWMMHLPQIGAESGPHPGPGAGTFRHRTNYYDNVQDASRIFRGPNVRITRA